MTCTFMKRQVWSHIGVYGSGTKDVAAAFPEFDVIIGGHDHKSIESEYEGGVLLLEPISYARELATIDL